jgi:hypothetical protein
VKKSVILVWTGVIWELVGIRAVTLVVDESEFKKEVVEASGLRLEVGTTASNSGSKDTWKVGCKDDWISFRGASGREELGCGRGTKGL